MCNLASLWGTISFTFVFTAFVNFASLLIHGVASSVNFIPQAVGFLYRSVSKQRDYQLTSPNPGTGGRVRRKEHDSDTCNVIEIAKNKTAQPTRVIIFHADIYFIYLIRAKSPRPITTSSSVFCSKHNNLHGDLLWVVNLQTHLTIPVTESLLESIGQSLQLACQVVQHGGYTSATKASKGTTPLKRKASNASVGKLQRGKRNHKSRQTNGDGDDNDDDEENNQHPNPNDVGEDPSAETEQIHWACPFFKFNPREHHRCVGKKLNTIDKLKQHIKRSHYSTKLHCHRCWRVFADDDQGTRESRSHGGEQCIAWAGPDMIYPEDNLTALLSTVRASSERDKWYQLWGQIFVGHARPASPYAEPNIVGHIAGLVSDEHQQRIRAEVRTVIRGLITNAANTILRIHSQPALPDAHIQWDQTDDEIDHIVDTVRTILARPALSSQLLRRQPPATQTTDGSGGQQAEVPPLLPRTAPPPPGPAQEDEQDPQHESGIGNDNNNDHAHGDFHTLNTVDPPFNQPSYGHQRLDPGPIQQWPHPEVRPQYGSELNYRGGSPSDFLPISDAGQATQPAFQQPLDVSSHLTFGPTQEPFTFVGMLNEDFPYQEYELDSEFHDTTNIDPNPFDFPPSTNQQ